MNKLADSAKDFLTSDEKWLGSAVTFAVLLGGAVALYAALPIITAFLGSLILAVGQLLVLGVLGLIAVLFVTLMMQERTWTEIWHLQRRFSHWLSGIAMKADPFGRMRAFANEYLQSQWNKFNTAAETLERQLVQKHTRIGTLESELFEATESVKALKTRHMRNNAWDTDEHHNMFRLLSQKITFTENSLAKLRKDEVKLALLIKIIDKWRTNFRFEIETTRMTADYLEEDFKQADATAGALEAASSAFGGGDIAMADKEVRQYIEKLTSGRIARAEVLMKQIPELTSLGDLKGDVAEDELMRRLRDLDTAADDAYREGQTEPAMITTGDPVKIVEAMKAEPKVPVTVRRYLK